MFTDKKNSAKISRNYQSMKDNFLNLSTCFEYRVIDYSYAYADMCIILNLYNYAQVSYFANFTPAK